MQGIPGNQTGITAFDRTGAQCLTPGLQVIFTEVSCIFRLLFIRQTNRIIIICHNSIPTHIRRIPVGFIIQRFIQCIQILAYRISGPYKITISHRTNLRIQCRQIGSRRRILTDIITIRRTKFSIHGTTIHQTRIIFYDLAIPGYIYGIRIHTIDICLHDLSIRTTGHIDCRFCVHLDHSMTRSRNIIQFHIGFASIGFHINRIGIHTIHIRLRNRSFIGSYHIHRPFCQILNNRLPGIRNIRQILQVRNICRIHGNRIRIGLHLRIQCGQVGARHIVSSNIISICCRTGFRRQGIIHGATCYHAFIPIGNRTRLNNCYIIRVYAIHIRLRNRHITVSGYIDRGFGIRLDYVMTCYRYIIQRNICFPVNRIRRSNHILNGTIYSTTGHDTRIVFNDLTVSSNIHGIGLRKPVSSLSNRSMGTIDHLYRTFSQITDNRLTSVINVI